MTIYLIPSPLDEQGYQGLSAMTPQILQQTHYYLVEEVRTARRFISGMQLGIKVAEQHFHQVNKSTTTPQIAEIFSQIPEGSSVGVISEAGCPGVADPGARVVAYAHKKGWNVWPLPGPSSMIMGLMGSGFNGQQFAFNGYLPVKPVERAQSIKALEQLVQRTGATQMFMETPFRNDSLLRDLLAHCHPDTELCIAAGLTSAQQLLRTLPVREWKKQVPSLHKIPTVFLLGRS